MQHSFFTRIRGFYSSATAFTRQGAITLARSIARPIHSTPAQKTFALIGGAVAIGAGVASFLAADFGLPPYDVLLNAISDNSGLSHGQSGWLVAVVLGTLAAVLGRRPDLWTLAWVVIVGFADGVEAPIELEDRRRTDSLRVVRQLICGGEGAHPHAFGLWVAGADFF